jgi:hypothetical protein
LKAIAFTTRLILLLLAVAPVTGAQSAIEKITLGPEQIGVVKTAPGISTRVSFPDPVQEVVCGDLYDPATGKGTFIIQRSGTAERPGNDIFLKPVAAKGLSNMFVKTADGKNTYSFDLKIVPTEQAHRAVNVVDAVTGVQPRPTGDAQSPPNDGSRGNSDKTAEEIERIKANAEQQGRTRADEIIRNARQQADRVIGEAESKGVELERQAAQRADAVIERRFMQAMILGIREIKAENPRATAKAINIMIDPPRVLIFNGKGYLRYVINNTGKQDFAYKSVVLEVGAGANNRIVASQINQSKAENTLSPGESITGVMVFDPKEVAETDKLMLFVRGEGDTIILRLTLQQP